MGVACFVSCLTHLVDKKIHHLGLGVCHMRCICKCRRMYIDVSCSKPLTQKLPLLFCADYCSHAAILWDIQLLPFIGCGT